MTTGSCHLVTIRLETDGVLDSIALRRLSVQEAELLAAVDDLCAIEWWARMGRLRNHGYAPNGAGAYPEPDAPRSRQRPPGRRQSPATPAGADPANPTPRSGASPAGCQVAVASLE